MPHFGEIQSLDDLIDVLLTALADGDILTYDAALEQWINEAPPQAATKEIFIPATIDYDGATRSKLGWHGGILVAGSGQLAITELHIPHDFTAMDEFTVVFIPIETLTPMYFFLRIDAAANGETRTTHTGTHNPSANTVANIIQEIDISTVVPAISAGDYVGVGFLCDMGENTNALVLGVRLKYT